MQQFRKTLSMRVTALRKHPRFEPVIKKNLINFRTYHHARITLSQYTKAVKIQ